METLTLADLAPYLPYNLRMINEKSGRIIELSGIDSDGVNLIFIETGSNYESDIWPFRPILRPLEDIPARLYEYYNFGNVEDCIKWVQNGECPYSEWVNLVEKHFDVFGLIEKGLAVSIHDIK